MIVTDTLEPVTLTLEQLGDAFKNKTRAAIYRLLLEERLFVNQVAARLGQAEANASFQITILERMGLLQQEHRKGIHGIRLYSRARPFEVSYNREEHPK